MRTVCVLIAVIGLGACADSKPMSSTSEPPSTRTITTNREAEAALGERVRATGTVRREKPGDAVVAPGLDLLCPDFRFDDALVDAEVTVEGTLRKMQMPEATVDETGAVSQGVAAGSPPRYALDDCTVL